MKSLKVDLPTNEGSFMSELSKLQSENERLDLAASKSSQANLPYDFQLASSHQFEELINSGG